MTYRRRASPAASYWAGFVIGSTSAVTGCALHLWWLSLMVGVVFGIVGGIFLGRYT